MQLRALGLTPGGQTDSSSSSLPAAVDCSSVSSCEGMSPPSGGASKCTSYLQIVSTDLLQYELDKIT